VLPLLEADFASAGCSAVAPKRFVAIQYGNGCAENAWLPKGAGASYQMSDLCGSLAPHQPKITFIKGLEYRNGKESPNNVSGHHDLPVMLTGLPLVEHNHDASIAVAGGPSIDQYLIDQARLTNPSEPRPLVFAYKLGREPAVSWTGARQPVSSEQDLYKVFDRLFGGDPSAGPVAVPPEQLEQMRAAKRSMLDVVGKDIQRFCSNLGSADRQRCEGHLSAFRDMEMQFGASTDASACGKPEIVRDFDPGDVRDMQKYMDAWVQVITFALASNFTRSINFIFGDGIGDAISYPHLGFGRNSAISVYDRGGNADHGEAHNNTEVHFKVRQWFMGEISKLLSSLDSVVENDGRTLLDNSVVLTLNNMATGGGHGLSGIPCFYAGSGGGYLKTGQYVQLQDYVPHNRLLHSVIAALGYDAEGFDGGRYGNELTELRA
jgi:hypothetical protein